MGELKLYKKFYQVKLVKTVSAVQQDYILMNPYALSATTFTAGSGDTESASIIENLVSITNLSTGIYFADLDPTLYAADVTYDLVWFIQYFSTAPVKKISTRFRINVNTITNQIEIEYINYPLEIEILNDSLEIDIS